MKLPFKQMDIPVVLLKNIKTKTKPTYVPSYDDKNYINKINI